MGQEMMCYGHTFRLISESKYGVQTKTIAVDFSQGIESGVYNGIREGLQGLDIGVLGKIFCQFLILK
jgi:hypothetical protein